MNDLSLFRYEGQQVRTVTIDGEPHFAAIDVCAVLEVSNPSQALTRLDDDESTLISNEGRKMNMVTESGLYSLVLGSRKPEAKAFKRWITREVIPSIRKTGSFGAQPALTGPELMAKALIQADGIMKQQTLALAAAQPAIDYTKRFVSNEDAVVVSDFAAQYGMTSPAMFNLLKEAKIIYRVKVTEHFSDKKDRIVEDFEYRAYADYLHLFDLRPQNKVVRYHNGKVRQTLYVRQAHALELGSLIGLGSTSTEMELAS